MSEDKTKNRESTVFETKSKAMDYAETIPGPTHIWQSVRGFEVSTPTFIGNAVFWY